MEEPNSRAPIKRHEALKDLSRDHHSGLLLCWKIRQGVRKNIDIKRINDYTDYFYVFHLKPHFIAEETVLFPLLGNNHAYVLKAKAEHKDLIERFGSETREKDDLLELANILENHIRFEERVLFNELQRTVDPEKLRNAELKHNAKRDENWADAFWS